MPGPYFRKIFVVQPSHDLSALKNYTDNIELLTTGYENAEDLAPKIELKLTEFDPDTDAFVPVGKLISTMISGMIIQKLVPDREIKIGIYRDRDYEFMSVGVMDAPF